MMAGTLHLCLIVKVLKRSQAHQCRTSFHQSSIVTVLSQYRFPQPVHLESSAYTTVLSCRSPPAVYSAGGQTSRRLSHACHMALQSSVQQQKRQLTAPQCSVFAMTRRASRQRHRRDVEGVEGGVGNKSLALHQPQLPLPATLHGNAAKVRVGRA